MAGFTGLRWKIAVKNEKVEREEKENTPKSSDDRLEYN